MAGRPGGALPQLVAGILVAGVLGAAGLTGAASASVPAPRPSAPSSSAPPSSASPVVVDELDGVASELAAVAVSSPDVALAERAVLTFRAERATAADDQAVAEADLARLQRDASGQAGERKALEDDLAAAQSRDGEALARAADFGARADGVKAVLEDLAAAAYMGATTQQAPLESATVSDADRRATYSRNVFDLKRDERRSYLDEQAAARADADTAQRESSTLGGRIDALDRDAEATRTDIAAAQHRRQDAIDRQADFEARLRDADVALAQARRTATVTGLDLPLVVLDALWKAARTENAERPACRVSWSLLAGISKIESGNGRYGSARVDRTGEVQPRIVGPALDGTAFALVPDTDHGRYDGDATYDRAVGPMQFIPSSWALFGRDGNGDGVADPNNYYDAALAAAEHLCRGGADTSTDAGRRLALLSYNPSEDYVRIVSAQAAVYARFPLAG